MLLQQVFSDGLQGGRRDKVSPTSSVFKEKFGTEARAGRIREEEGHKEEEDEAASSAPVEQSPPESRARVTFADRKSHLLELRLNRRKGGPDRLTWPLGAAQ
ncbi:unnamed protein product [Durusdinium trenchii]|uniref:Uncharacterized protein n=2 Tax=Durusdinium trenchii TaxID=1381693 RepID=A0ABP0LXZ4_9DINO